jgi:hypothetical protein
MRLRQASEGGNNPHSDVSDLWSTFFQTVLSSFAHGLTDFLAFLVIVTLAVKSATSDFKMPQILRAIVHDSTTYFLVIFTSHFVLEMTLLLARVSIPILRYMSVVENGSS